MTLALKLTVTNNNESLPSNQVFFVTVFKNSRNSKHDIDESEMKDRVPVTGSDSLCNPFPFLCLCFSKF